MGVDYMALIKCPDCGNNISDKSEMCIYCGYPLAKEKLIELYNVIYLGMSYIPYEKKIALINILGHLCKSDRISAYDIVKLDNYTIIKSVTKSNAEWIVGVLQQYKCNTKIEQSKDSEASDQDQMISSYINNNGGCTIICPRCGSNSVTTGQRGFSLLTGFLGSNKTVNRCGKCGYSWKP